MKGRARELGVAGALMERAVAAPGFSPAARRVAEAPIAPKPDPLSAEERAEVERKLANGEVTRCPPRRHALDGATVLSREEFKAMRGRIAARDMKFRRLRERGEEVQESGGGRPPEPEGQPAPAAETPGPELKVRREGFVWWVCTEDGTRVAGPYGDRKLALAAAESGGA